MWERLFRGRPLARELTPQVDRQGPARRSGSDGAAAVATRKLDLLLNGGAADAGGKSEARNSSARARAQPAGGRADDASLASHLHR